MSSDNFKIPGGCKAKYIEKMYFAKYMYKLVFEIDKTKLVRTPDSHKMSYWSYRHTSYLNRADLLNDLVRLVKRNIKSTDFRFRAESTKVSVFINDIDDINRMLEKVGSRLIEFEYPVNEKHADLIDQHRKVVVRNTLFEKNFKFKIYLKYNSEERERRYSDLKTFMEGFGHPGQDWHVNSGLRFMFYTSKAQRFSGYTMAVYLKNVDDLMMFQLRYNEDISKIEEAVLVSDL